MFAYSLQFNQMSVKFIISQSFQIGVKQSYSDYLKKQIDLSEKRHLSFHIKYIKITHPPTDIFEIWYFILLIWSLTHYKEFHLCSVYGWYFSIFIEQWKLSKWKLARFWNHKKLLISWKIFETEEIFFNTDKGKGEDFLVG